MESKKEIYDLLPWQYYPNTIFVRAHTPLREILGEIRRENLQFPLIAKPDIGMKGLSVKKLCSEDELLEYAIQSKVNFLVQEFICFENEVGIFYYRFPNKEKGHISGIVKKEFLAIVGDGQSTMTELLKRDKRFILQLSTLKKTYGNELKRILQKGEERILVPYGNHDAGLTHLKGSPIRDVGLAAEPEVEFGQHICLLEFVNQRQLDLAARRRLRLYTRADKSKGQNRPKS